MKFLELVREPGCHEGASRAAAPCALLGACRLNKVNPVEWPLDALVRVNFRSDETAVSLLPMNWKKKSVA
jgi:hypothetical protein